MSVHIINTDCYEALKTLPSQSVQSCITSPPYFGLRDYGIGSIFCRYQRIKGYQYVDTYQPYNRRKTLLYITGWYDRKNKVHYVTWVRKNNG